MMHKAVVFTQICAARELSQALPGFMVEPQQNRACEARATVVVAAAARQDLDGGASRMPRGRNTFGTFSHGDGGG